MERSVRRIIAVVGAFALWAQPASAATTVFASSVFATTGNVVSAANATGAADGSSSTIMRVAGGSSLTLSMLRPITGVNTFLAGLRLTPATNVQIAVGDIVGGVAVYSVNTALPAGLGPNFSLDLTAACKSISATGCSLLRITVNGAPGSGFSLDGVLGTTPEPSTWALMLLGFAAVAWRLKSRRAQTRLLFPVAA